MIIGLLAIVIGILTIVIGILTIFIGFLTIFTGILTIFIGIVYNINNNYINNIQQNNNYERVCASPSLASQSFLVCTASV